ncbi:transmembrane protein 243-like isoform X1 [Mercenaria mercenaria]|uniref:transmembrane protein 243-like isoform X1 n=1 Tax=Mercenaria mercenaria TaxID=6596 RepID=UPI00234EC2AA|nr:transmembrane protein 243-like isoform X1 [Mercenaria mercenaria]
MPRNDDSVFSEEFLGTLRRSNGNKRLQTERESRGICKDRVCNLVVATFTGILVVVTLVSAFIFPHWPPNGINIFFAVVMVFVGFAHLLLIFWYRQGDLEPKFLRLIFYNAFTMILLCIVGNLYIHNV